MMRDFADIFKYVAGLIAEGKEIPFGLDSDDVDKPCEYEIEIYREETQKHKILHQITKTPLLHIAIFYNNEEAVKQLLSKNANPNSECSCSERTWGGHPGNRKIGDSFSPTYTALQLCKKLNKLGKPVDDNIMELLPKNQNDSGSDNDSDSQDSKKKEPVKKKKSDSDSDSDNGHKQKVLRNQMFKKAANSKQKKEDDKKGNQKKVIKNRSGK